MKKIYLFFKTIFHEIQRSIFGFQFVCRKNPSCSEYALEEIQKHGILKSLKPILLRVISCHS